ncbi:hypothetical protein SAMN02746065_115107 [Desulfocicer vacuolatum DSM 3385]|uniref:Uncharacterized protein n=1 Tax=Desulfocicer vacuolatum DSM 3385 TaxID=1121400 RepID=A0A1W2D6V0_9BACT|nr:hypothetical protein SAMN02746065_115107 [Desulfocicer vacuolatum DSM 3385]
MPLIDKYWFEKMRELTLTFLSAQVILWQIVLDWVTAEPPVLIKEQQVQLLFHIM